MNFFNSIRTSITQSVNNSFQTLKFIGRKSRPVIDNDFVHTSFEESSIHGMAHVGKSKFHIIERLFWLIIIILSIYIAIIICLGQWERYQTNPTVLSVETNYRSWVYRPCGFTMCSSYINDDISESIVLRKWGVTRNDTKFQHYMDFVRLVTKTTYLNFHLYETFANDPSLEHVDYYDILLEMLAPVKTPVLYFTMVITEMGLCQTSSKLYHLQSPYKKDEIITTPDENDEICRSIECKQTALPLDTDKNTTRIYYHNEDDIMTADTEYALIDGSVIVSVYMDVHVITASENLRRLSPKARKCLFYDEPQSEYVDLYTPSLCQMVCRIKAAIQACGCVPFLYSIDTGYPRCSPAGLVCLSKYNWYGAECVCPELCQSISYIKIRTDITQFEFTKMLTLILTMPKNRIRRNVLFSFEDLLVSFGGAAALFVGLSFLSIVEFFYFFIEYLFKICCLTQRTSVG